MNGPVQSLFFSAVLSDFEDASNHLEDDAVKREVNLVADSLRLGGAILGKSLSYDIIRNQTYFKIITISLKRISNL